ncbi:MAG: endopeptidase La [Oscillospiraceae bacterium]|nr:endopeptidase La [Oscillospiraceae bacterium]
MRGKGSEAHMPMLAMRGIVVFPGAVMHFDVMRGVSETALKAAIDSDKLIFLTAQKNSDTENPAAGDIFKVGVVAEIRQIIKSPDNNTRVLIEGKYRAKLVGIVEEEPFLTASVKELPYNSKENEDALELDAVIRVLKGVFGQYCYSVPKMPKELRAAVLNENDPQRLFDAVAFNISVSVEDKQLLLEENHIISRLGMLIAILAREIEILDIERNIHEKVNARINKNQRDYYLREQIKVLSNLLGEDKPCEHAALPENKEVEEYIRKIGALKLSSEISEKLRKEAERLSKTLSGSQEAFVIRNYLDNVLELPWSKTTKDKTDLGKAKAILDKEHYGLQKVKERILESIAVRSLKPELKGQIICLVGPPGIGKTSIGKSLAKALGRKYARVSLGGVRDEAEIRGHRKTYVGAMPGRIIEAFKKAGTKNPLILLDEIDKMTRDMRGDPSSALLEVLDSEQNGEFRDHYIEVPFDLSNALFVTTANSIQTIDPPLLDRMDVIDLTSYTREEKFHIARGHLIPKQIKASGLKTSLLKIEDGAVYAIIDGYTKEAGVRSLERRISAICRKAAKKIVTGEIKKAVVTAGNIDKYLGARKYLDESLTKRDETGLANGLAWTSTGGVILPLEAMILDGKGEIEITGSLGEVMKESAKIAISYVRDIADKYNINKDFYKEKDIHIHAPEGATPKDGPSAGVTMTAALISALSGIPVRRDVAMTGEITLHGKVMPIGGLREKTMAAYKAKMKTVILPLANRSDLEEVDDAVKASMNFVFAETLSDVLDTALVAPKNEFSITYVKPDIVKSDISKKTEVLTGLSAGK